MPVHDDLGTRMKEFYENIPKTKLMRRCPVAMRIDGKAFHTFTAKLKKPFDYVLVKSMQDTMKALCENIQGCVLGYTQSDEITLILVDYQTFSTSAWFDNEVQKMCSIGASIATLYFNKAFTKYTLDEYESGDKEYYNTLAKCIERGAMFDCRVFNIPKEEVCNLVYWRQLDASKNSVQMVARSLFSHKQLFGKSTSAMQDMMMEQYNVNWNDYPTELKRGSACIRDAEGKWIIDHEMPILKGEGREYVDKLIWIGEE